MSIVVTGVGMVNAAGITTAESWATILAGHTAIGVLGAHLPTYEGRFPAGEVTELEQEFAASERDDRAVVIGVRALAEAITAAGLEGAYPANRIGLSLGTALGGAWRIERFHLEGLPPEQASSQASDIGCPLHALADHLAARFSLFGPRVVHSNACAAGAVAIANGFEFLASGAADAVVVGGVDPLALLPFGGFAGLGSLAAEPCRPYTKSDGLTLGEGAGFLVLERHQAARQRGAPILAEVAGYGLSADAYHATAPDPRGRGALAAMESALRMSQLAAADVDYINGHGTGTPANDGVERRIVGHFSERMIPISSTKSIIGHTLGAAGAIESAVTVLALRHQMLPPTAASEDFIADPDFDIVPRIGRAADVRVAMSNSFAFGGNNASVIFCREPRTEELAPIPTRRVSITGFAALVGEARDSIEAREMLFSGGRAYGGTSLTIDGYGPYPVGELAEEVQTKYVNPSYVRKLDPLSKRSASVTARILRETGLTRTQIANTGLVFATCFGPISTVESVQLDLVTHGNSNARAYPNTVMNAAAGHVALLNGLKGPTATYCSGSTSGVSALHLAQRLIETGSCDRVLVLAADEVTKALVGRYARVPSYLSTSTAQPFAATGCVYCGVAAVVLLEASEVRGERPELAHIAGFGFASDGSDAGRLDPNTDALRRSMAAALAQSSLASSDLDVIIAAANGRLNLDQIERDALRALDSPALISTPKAVFGETLAASALLGVIQAIWMAQLGEVPQTVSPDRPGERTSSPAGSLKNVLINAIENGGNYQSLVVNL